MLLRLTRRGQAVGGGQEEQIGQSRRFGVEILAHGLAAEVDGHPLAASPALEVRRLPGRVLVPALVNAHTHLDLTHIGPHPELAASNGEGFSQFIALVRSSRTADVGALAASVRAGAALLRRGGTVAVGDIQAVPPSVTLGEGPTPHELALAPELLGEKPLAGVGFAEYFALSEPAARQADDRLAGFLRGGGGVGREEGSAGDRGGRWGLRRGVQPHAAYSVGGAGYGLAFGLAGRGVPMCTHLSETPEEVEFVARGTGPFRTLLEGLGLWNADLAERFGRGLSPVEVVVGEYLEGKGDREGAGEMAGATGRAGGAPPLLVHCNALSDRDIELIARSGCCVVYCPRSSKFFGAPGHFGPHRFVELMAAGVTVCLGTDSVINIPGAELDRNGLSVLDEARRLVRSGATDVRTAVDLATRQGARALGLEEELFDLCPGWKAGVVAADPAGLWLSDSGGGSGGEDLVSAAGAGSDVPID